MSTTMHRTAGPWKLIMYGHESYPYPLTIHNADDTLWVARDGVVSSLGNARLIAAAPATKDALLNALGWYYEEFYDGASEHAPDWVDDAREALADALVGSRDARTRYEAVERALDEWRAE